MKRILLPILLLALPEAVWAAGTNSAEFLRLGVGAPAAQSEAAASVDRGPTAMLWNPAGLATMERPEAYAANLGMPQGVNYNFVAGAMPVKTGPLAGTVGASLQVLSQTPIDRLSNTGAYEGRFSSDSEAAAISWAGKRGGFRVGGTLRFIRESIDGDSGMGPSADIGAQRDFGKLSMGAALTNLGPGVAVRGVVSPLPTTMRVGANYEANSVLTGALEVSHSEGRGARGHMGLSVVLWGPMSIAAGYAVEGASPDGPNGFSSGVTMRAKNLTADFSYRPYGVFGSTLQVGLGMRFGAAGQARP